MLGENTLVLIQSWTLMLYVTRGLIIYMIDNIPTAQIAVVGIVTSLHSLNAKVHKTFQEEISLEVSKTYEEGIVDLAMLIRFLIKRGRCDY